MLRKNVLTCAAIAVCFTTHAVLLGSGHGGPQTAGTAGEKRPTSIEHRGRAIPNTLEEIVDPTHTAGIVHEMVRDIAAHPACIAFTQPHYNSALVVSASFGNELEE